MEVKEGKGLIEEGLDKGYLKNKKVYIKPLIQAQPLLGANQKGHPAQFMMDECRWGYTLGVTRAGHLINPFESEEERKYFESIYDRSLNYRDDVDNFWTTFIVYIDKSSELLAGRKFLDLSIPEDNLKYRVLKSCETDFAIGKEDYDTNPFRKFILVDEDFSMNEDAGKLKDETDVYIEIGKIRTSKTEMIRFLTLYYAMKRSGKIVAEDNKNEWYESEIMGCLKKDFEIVKKIVDDKDRNIKSLISDGLVKGAVERVGAASYRLPGMTESYTMEVFISVIKDLKEVTDPLYLTLVAQVESKSTKKKVVKE